MITHTALPEGRFQAGRHGQKDEDTMRGVIVAVLSLPLLLGGCVSFSSSNPPPPTSTTVVVPAGTAVVCSDGTAPPCRY
jgi:hypothetical protein